MLGVHHPRVDIFEDLNFLHDPAMLGFDPGPIAIDKSELFGRIGMDLHLGPGVSFAQFFDLAMLGVKEGMKATARDQYQGILSASSGVRIALSGGS